MYRLLPGPERPLNRCLSFDLPKNRSLSIQQSSIRPVGILDATTQCVIAPARPARAPPGARRAATGGAEHSCGPRGRPASPQQPPNVHIARLARVRACARWLGECGTRDGSGQRRVRRRGCNKEEGGQETVQAQRHEAGCQTTVATVAAASLAAWHTPGPPKRSACAYGDALALPCGCLAGVYCSRLTPDSQRRAVTSQLSLAGDKAEAAALLPTRAAQQPSALSSRAEGGR